MRLLESLESLRQSSDLWVSREEHMDHNLGTSSELVDDLIERLVDDPALDHDDSLSPDKKLPYPTKPSSTSVDWVFSFLVRSSFFGSPQATERCF